MKNYDEKLRLFNSTIILDTDSVDIDELIINNTAQKTVTESVEKLFSKMRASIEEEVKTIFRPRFTFDNVSESGLMICGKENNLACGKSTLYEMFDAFYHACSDEEVFKKATYTMGRKSALHFADDFRKILNIDGKLMLPYSEEIFMKLYSKFDKRSAWWDGEIDYLESGIPNNPYISAVIKRPFTTYPWIKKTACSKANRFLEGYILTLFNSCADILRIMWDAQDKDIKKRKLAIAVEPCNEPDILKEYYQIKYCNDYIDQWLEIDKIVYISITRLLSLNSIEDTVDLLVTVEDLYNSLKKLIKKMPDVNFIDIKNRVEGNIRDIGASKFYINLLLNDLRIMYEDYRIDFCKKTFYSVQGSDIDE